MKSNVDCPEIVWPVLIVDQDGCFFFTQEKHASSALEENDLLNDEHEAWDSHGRRLRLIWEKKTGLQMHIASPETDLKGLSTAYSRALNIFSKYYKTETPDFDTINPMDSFIRIEHLETQIKKTSPPWLQAFHRLFGRF